MKRIMIGLLAATMIGGTAYAGGDMWKESDANGDGSISRAEYDASVTAGWTRKDVDKNGQLSAAEAGMKKGDKARSDAGTNGDTNGDGQISSAEYTAHKAAWWTAADTNRDGSLSQAEYRAAKAKKS